jgi:hypothetical protein
VTDKQPYEVLVMLGLLRQGQLFGAPDPPFLEVLEPCMRFQLRVVATYEDKSTYVTTTSRTTADVPLRLDDMSFTPAAPLPWAVEGWSVKESYYGCDATEPAVVQEPGFARLGLHPQLKEVELPDGTTEKRFSHFTISLAMDLGRIAFNQSAYGYCSNTGEVVDTEAWPRWAGRLFGVFVPAGESAVTVVREWQVPAAQPWATKALSNLSVRPNGAGSTTSGIALELDHTPSATG